MFYIIKKNEDCLVVEAECQRHRRWVNGWGLDAHYEYYGVNENDGLVFDSRDIIKKSAAKTKEKVRQIYPEYFL